MVAPLNNRRRSSPIARCLLPRSMNFPSKRRGMKRAAYAKINIPVDFIISIQHDARHTLHFRCLFNACISTNCALFHLTERITLVPLYNSPINVYPLYTFIRYIVTSIDILFTDKSKIWKRVNLSNESSANHSRLEMKFSLFQTLFEKFECNSVSNILKRFHRYSISAPRKITPTSLSSSFSTKNHLEILEFYIPKWSFLTRLSPVRSVACEFRARLWKQRHLGSGTGCILNRIQFIDVDGALTCSCHVLGSEAASSSVHSVECTSLARVSNILHALLPLHSRNNFCRARVLPVSFRTRNARN